MRMTLERMRLDNFKGVKHLELNFAAGRTDISGANGTGKTTIADAFCWVLYNQNANGDAPGSDNFREKPLDENGQTVHNLDTTVELICTLDGARFDLKRTQTENWIKKRGNAKATFQGNVSTYWINGVETKLTDFKARIKAIADDEIFRLIGSLSAFNALEWRKRRQQLLNLAGQDVDGELLARDEYRPIADEIAARGITPDELRKVLADQRRSINKELERLPIRIDEASKAMPDLKPEDIKDAEYIIAESKRDVESIDQQIIDAKSKSVDVSRRNEILACEQECINIRRSMIDNHEAGRRKLSNEADAASENFRRMSAAVSDLRKDVERLTASITTLTAKRDSLRTLYREVKSKPVAVNGTCPTCGQALPPELVNEARAKAETEKRERLMSIQSDGKAVADELTDRESQWTETKARLDESEARAKAAQEALEAANAAIRDYPAMPDETASEALQAAEERLKALKTPAHSTPDDAVAALTERKRDLLAIIDRNLTVLNRRDIMHETEQRIKAYEAQQQELGAALSETEMLIDLAERFVQDRCGALEASINSHFPTVRWKLFDQQINGGMTDTCIAMLDCDGVYVPYESANTASQIAADVEIVDVLSDHYDIRVPLFVDNAERVNVLPRIDSQTITLSVSTDSELNIKEA